MISWENPWSASTNFFWRVRTLPLYFIWSIVGFISGWVQTRQLRFLLMGAPALAVAILVIALTIRSREPLRSETIRRYIETAQQLMRNNQVDQADFYLNRLRTLEFQSDPMLSTRAEIAVRRERNDLAEISFRQMLTNSDHTQDALAHKQLAMIELKKTQDPHSQIASEVIRHLEQALEANPGEMSCHQLLANLFLTRGDLNSVAEHLEPLANIDAAAQIELARVYEKLGRSSKKVDAAIKAEAYFAAVVSQLKTPSRSAEPPEPQLASQLVKGSLNWSESLIMQNRLDDASQVVTAALDRVDSPELRRRLAAIYVRKINDLSASDESWRKRWELVTLSRNYDPDSRESLIILANIAAHGTFDLRPLALKEIQPYLDNGQAPPAAYYLVGTAAAETQNWELALPLLRQAVKLEPRADISWNNLAHTLSLMPNSDLQEAERCINEAIRIDSTPAIYHDTRGQIMVKQQRWAEAVRELELALPNLPPEARIHEGLAEAYLQLGDDDLSEYHRTRQVALSK